MVLLLLWSSSQDKLKAFELITLLSASGSFNNSEQTKKSSSTSVVEENAASQFCCEAPEMFREQQNFFSFSLWGWKDDDFYFLSEIVL